MLLAALLTGALWLIETPVPSSVRAVGTLTTLLSLAPGVDYLLRLPAYRRPVPFLPILGLLYALYFGLPFAFGVPKRAGGPVSVDLSSDLLVPSALALLGWTVLLASYWLTARAARVRRWDLSRFTDDGVLRKAGFVLLGVGLAGRAASYSVVVPAMFVGLARLIGLLGWLGAAFLVAAWSLRLLGALSKVLAVMGITVLSMLALGTGSVANPGRSWLVLFVAAWIGRKGRVGPRFWLVGTALVLTLLILRGSAMEYREHAWYGADLRPVEGALIYVSIVAQQLSEHGPVAVLSNSMEVVGKRNSYAAVFADVVRRTPESVAYWNGRTYPSLVGAFVPRFVWPSKPVKDLGQRFGHRYGYLDPGDQHTSFNFPFLIEFYANFGAVGVVIGMAIVGLLYSVLNDLLNGRNQGVVGSILALGLLLPVITNIESDFSLVFGGLILNGLALYAVLLSMTTRRLPRVGSSSVGALDRSP